MSFVTTRPCQLKTTNSFSWLMLCSDIKDTGSNWWFPQPRNSAAFHSRQRDSTVLWSWRRALTLPFQDWNIKSEKLFMQCLLYAREQTNRVTFIHMLFLFHFLFDWICFYWIKVKYGEKQHFTFIYIIPHILSFWA